MALASRKEKYYLGNYFVDEYDDNVTYFSNVFNSGSSTQFGTKKYPLNSTVTEITASNSRILISTPFCDYANQLNGKIFYEKTIDFQNSTLATCYLSGSNVINVGGCNSAQDATMQLWDSSIEIGSISSGTTFEMSIYSMTTASHIYIDEIINESTVNIQLQNTAGIDIDIRDIINSSFNVSIGDVPGRITTIHVNNAYNSTITISSAADYTNLNLYVDNSHNTNFIFTGFAFKDTTRINVFCTNLLYNFADKAVDVFKIDNSEDSTSEDYRPTIRIISSNMVITDSSGTNYLIDTDASSTFDLINCRINIFGNNVVYLHPGGEDIFILNTISNSVYDHSSEILGSFTLESFV